MIAKAINRIFEAGYKRVIVPGFGAFIKRNSGEIVFTDMLCEDDGVLIASLIGSGMSALEARQTVDKFISSLRASLALTGRASVYGIGAITKTASGAYTLEAEQYNTTYANTDNKQEEKPLVEPHIHTNTIEEKHIEEVKEEQQQVLDTEAHATTAPQHPDVNVATEVSSHEIEAIGEEDLISELEAVIESEEAPESYIHPSFANKARLRNALYGNTDEKPETIQAVAIDSTDNTTPEPDVFQNNKTDEVTHDKSEPEQESVIDEIKEPASQLSDVTAKKVSEIHTVKSDFTEASANDDNEPYKPQVNIRRPSKSKKRIDGVMVVAIIALIITLGIIAYGYLAERDINEMRGEDEVMIEMEQPAE